LPTALLDLRQGAGRLLRRSEDRGIVVLCHEQLMQKKYAQAALAMLPGEGIRHVEAAAIGPAIVQAAGELAIRCVDG
jgi:ATP-dependent DNA helicase DinG